MGILPLQFQAGQNAENLGLKGTEQITIHLDASNIEVGQLVSVSTSTGVEF
jgi:aconitase A